MNEYNAFMGAVNMLLELHFWKLLTLIIVMGLIWRLPELIKLFKDS